MTEKELDVLNLLIEDPAYTYSAIAEKLSISRKTVSSRIKALKEKHIIERVGSDTKKGGYWKVCGK